MQMRLLHLQNLIGCGGEPPPIRLRGHVGAQRRGMEWTCNAKVRGHIGEYIRGI